MTANLIDDVYSRDAVAVTDGAALRASQYIPDTITPQLLSYTVDMNAGVLTLYFSEAVSITTIPSIVSYLFASRIRVYIYQISRRLLYRAV